MSLVLTALIFSAQLIPSGEECVKCHEDVTPGIVADWRASEHSQNDVFCDACHGDEHSTKSDYKKANLPTPETCANCHEDQVEQFKRGKHAKAWAAMKAMPTAHWQPMELMDGKKGCGGCHKIGLMTDAERKELREKDLGYGGAACDSCHTRHVFSAEEARQPQACRTCHMGFDHPQWEMYSSSKHGVRNEMKQLGIMHKDSSAPTCQSCHLQNGDHENRTPWGFWAIRLPMPEDKEWAADRTTILQAIGVLDPAGNPTPRLEVLKANDTIRTTQEAFDKERQKLLSACSECHSDKFAKAELASGDKLIKKADHVMAQAIRIIADLYKDGILKRPDNYADDFPDLFTLHDSPTSIENTLFVMFMKHRQRTFQGAFHVNPDYALWYGWSELQRDLTEIADKAAELRELRSLIHKKKLKE
ncbi:cytochrome C [Myxococcota bacterium]|nr:cytochrome C [Myxococcota bacterium]